MPLHACCCVHVAGRCAQIDTIKFVLVKRGHFLEQVKWAGSLEEWYNFFGEQLSGTFMLLCKIGPECVCQTNFKACLPACGTANVDSEFPIEWGP